LAFEVKALPMDVVLECLALREQRVSVDMVRDEVEAELNKVCTSIEKQLVKTATSCMHFCDSRRLLFQAFRDVDVCIH